MEVGEHIRAFSGRKYRRGRLDGFAAGEYPNEPVTKRGQRGHSVALVFVPSFFRRSVITGLVNRARHGNTAGSQS